MALIEITDAADPRLADFCDLTDADVRPDRRGIVIAEGVTAVERLIASPYRVRAIVGVRHRVAPLSTVDAPVYVVDKWTLSDVVGFHVTRGVLASADRLPPGSPSALLTNTRRVAVLEGLNDFENLGALFRNAAAPVALNGTSGSRVSRSRTSSIAQKTPSPRTSPTDGCRAASSASPGAMTSLPIRRACSTMPSSLKMPMDATALAHASGWPE